MRFILPALAVAMLVSGCVSDDKQRARDMRVDNNRCQSMGFQPGTQAMANCMATASGARQADKDRAVMNAPPPAMPSQPQTFSNDDDNNASTPAPPMDCKTTESTSTDDNGNTVTRSRQRCSSF
jgi:hypothetical protein